MRNLLLVCAVLTSFSVSANDESLPFAISNLSSNGSSQIKGFDDLVDKLVGVTSAKPRSDIYNYLMEYELKSGDAAAYFVTGIDSSAKQYKSTKYSLSRDIFDVAKKNMIISGITDDSKSMWGHSFIDYQCVVNEYEKQGHARGNYHASVRILKRDDNSVYVLGDYEAATPPNDFKSDTTLNIEDNSIIVTYSDNIFLSNNVGFVDVTKKLKISLNKGLDCQISFESDKFDGYQDAAYFNSGKLNRQK